MLSGTRALIILQKRLSSLIKKKEMKTMENTPTTMPAVTDATEPRKLVTLVTLITERICSRRAVTTLNLGPRLGNNPLIPSLT